MTSSLPDLHSGVLDHLLAPLSLPQFVAQHYTRLPHAAAAGADWLHELGSWSTVETLFDSPDADIRLSKQGALLGEPRPSFDQAREHFRAGYTIFVRHAERHHPRLAELAAGFARDLRAPIDIHLFCTPAGTPGFGWHYDAEEVFILQTHGTKHYELRKNTVNPWPLVETLPENMQYHREIMPLLRCSLSPGDCLYIPNGYWHHTTAETDAISLAVGALAPAALDLFDFLRHELLDSLLWRQRLPLLEQPDDAQKEQLQLILAELRRDMLKRLDDPRLTERYLAQRYLTQSCPDASAAATTRPTSTDCDRAG